MNIQESIDHYFLLRSVKFYLAKDGRYGFNKINSGYRCRYHEEYLKKPTTNHMGKALDLHFNDKNGRTRKVSDIETIRKDIFNKYLGAKWDWKERNIFNLESTRVGATTWVHYDVREFDKTYLEDKFFVKNLVALNGKSITALAIELGYTNTCFCMGTGKAAANAEKPSVKKDNRVDPKTLKTSQNGKKFIKDWEKYYKVPYDDSEGYATIGYGYLIAYKSYKRITKSDVANTDITWAEFETGITEERAQQLFEEKIEKYEKAVYRDVTVKLYQYEFDALASLLFNCGADFLSTGKAPKLYKNLLAEKYEEAAKEFLDITNDGTSGLVKRRNAENNMFLKNIYNSTH